MAFLFWNWVLALWLIVSSFFLFVGDFCIFLFVWFPRKCGIMKEACNL